MKKLSYNVQQIVNKLYSTIPLVPSGNLVQDIMQDIQCGLYDECGDPNENWDKWQERCVELLKQRKILGNARLKKQSYHDSNDRDCAIVYIDGLFFEAETHNQALTLYTSENNIRRRNNPSSYKREVLENELYNNNQLSDKEFCCLNKVLYDPIQREDVKRIFIDEETLQNISLDNLVTNIKSYYSGFDVYIDNNSACAHDMEEYIKVANFDKEYSWSEVFELVENSETNDNVETTSKRFKRLIKKIGKF